jgi:hypothetical protein
VIAKIIKIVAHEKKNVEIIDRDSQGNGVRFVLETSAACGTYV